MDCPIAFGGVTLECVASKRGDNLRVQPDVAPSKSQTKNPNALLPMRHARSFKRFFAAFRTSFFMMLWLMFISVGNFHFYAYSGKYL